MAYLGGDIKNSLHIQRKGNPFPAAVRPGRAGSTTTKGCFKMKTKLLKKGALTVGALALTTGAAGTLAASSASAAVLPAPPRVTAEGSIELGSPLQYEVFALWSGRHQGEVDYTNFTYAEPGSGVWAPAGEAPSGVSSPLQLVFNYQGSPYAHTLNGGLKLTALSNNRLAFTGTGYYDGGAITWKINGQITGDRITAVIRYNGSSYQVILAGRIAPNGICQVK